MLEHTEVTSVKLDNNLHAKCNDTPFYNITSFEPHHEKTGLLPPRKQRHSIQRLCLHYTDSIMIIPSLLKSKILSF